MNSFLAPSFWIFVMAVAGIYVIFALGLQIQYGVGGIMNFGQVGMMALSSYTMAILVITYGWNLYLAAFVGVIVAALGGAFLGLTTLRLRGDYFAIVSIAFSEILRYVINNSDGFTGGAQGSLAIPSPKGYSAGYTSTFEKLIHSMIDQLQPIFGSWATRNLCMMIITWGTAIILMLLVSRLERTSWARVLRASREDDNVPAALGKNVFKYRLQSLILGSVLGGIAGIFWAVQYSIITPDDFQTSITFFAWMVIILGGATAVRGVPVGAVLFSLLYAGTRFFNFPPFTWLSSVDRAYLRVIIIGVILILLMLKRPQGFFGKREEMNLGQ
jgi:branched-chain amino acid transport system permease protein